MKLNELTIGEALQMAALFASTTSQFNGTLPHPAVGKYCVIRTYSAGVHVGKVEYVNGREVKLSDSRRIWSWTGALSCSEIAANGITGGKVAVALPEIYLAEAIEIIPASQEAEACLRKIA